MSNTDQEKRRQHVSRAIATGARLCGMMIVRLFFFAILALVLAVVVMWLWNWLMPGLFGLAAISYWQAFGLMILARLILGTLGMGLGRFRWHDKRHMTDRFTHYRHMCGDMGRSMDVNNTMKWWHNYKRFWRDEGKAAFGEYLKRAKDEEPKGKTDKK
jgi:hypothetical protein